jgi:transposase InsO family protein
LLNKIREVYEASLCTYGSPRVHAALRQAGISCGRQRVARLMRKNGLKACQKRRKRPMTTKPGPGPIAENVLDRDFVAQRPNEKWVTDITYIDTWQGWLYLAVILDLFSRKIVGWAMADHLKSSLAERALLMALNQRSSDDPLLHHSDRGCQFTSKAYQAHLSQPGIIVSMGRTGNCYDNAVAESFFGTLKAECAAETFTTQQHARTTIFEYIESWYNRKRLHSTLGYLSPEQFERLHS